MKPLEGTTKLKLAGARGPVRDAAAAECCAGLLLETAPRLMRAVRMAIAALEAPALTIPQFRALQFVEKNTGANLSATADFLGLTLPSTSKLMDQLVRRGMVARDDAADDRRHMTLRMTAKGDALLKSALASVRRHLAQMLGGLGSAELAALSDALGMLRESFHSPATLTGEGSGGAAPHRRDGRPGAKSSASAAFVVRHIHSRNAL